MMPRLRAFLVSSCLVMGCAIGSPAVVQGQARPVLPDSLQHHQSWVWTPMFEHEGVVFDYLHYGYDGAGRVSSSVVVKLTNTNPHAVQYRFKMLFRSATGEEVVAPVAGILAAGEIKTGDDVGLFWMPFAPGVDIAEVGLRGYAVEPDAMPQDGV